MPIRTNADLDFMLQDAGLPVVSAASSTYGILRTVDTLDQTDGAQFQKRATVLTIRTGSIADLAGDLPITIDGAPYVVRLTNLESDGALTKVLVAEVKT